jgi:protein-disulfide isomerase
MTSTQKQITAWTISAAVLALIIFVAVWGARSSTSSSGVPAVTEVDHVLGSRTAKAVLIEYSDFQCPACAAYEPILQQLKQQYGDDMAIVYRQFPLRQTHRFAQAASQASEAADLQGKFWEFHDLLFERQSSWSQALNIKEAMVGYAKELGLDGAKFTADYDSQQVKDRIDIDVASGNAADIPGTPTFFLNGERLNPQSFNDFKNAIDTLLAS